MSKTVKYGYGLASESVKEALKPYGFSFGNLEKSEKVARMWAERDKKKGLIGKNSKPKIYKITVEVLD